MGELAIAALVGEYVGLVLFLQGDLERAKARQITTTIKLREMPQDAVVEVIADAGGYEGMTYDVEASQVRLCAGKVRVE